MPEVLEQENDPAVIKSVPFSSRIRALGLVPQVATGAFSGLVLFVVDRNRCAMVAFGQLLEFCLFPGYRAPTKAVTLQVLTTGSQPPVSKPVTI